MISPRHLKYLRFQQLKTIMKNQKLLNFPVILSQLFPKLLLSKAATAKHQLFLRCLLSKVLAMVNKSLATANNSLATANSHTMSVFHLSSLQRQESKPVDTAHLVANAVAMLLPRLAAMVVAMVAALVLQEAASVLPKLATANKATANPKVAMDLERAAMVSKATVNPSSAATANKPRASVATDNSPRAASADTDNNPRAVSAATDNSPRAVSVAKPEASSANNSSKANPKAATVANPEVDTASPAAAMVAPEADTEAAKEATVDSKTTATENKAAMALPEAVQVTGVDMVESAPTEVDMAVPDMEAQKDGEELSFCVYGLNA